MPRVAVLSEDQNTAIVRGRRFVFVPYTPEDPEEFRQCGGYACALRPPGEGCPEGFLACISDTRSDGLDGYWKEVS